MRTEKLKTDFTSLKKYVTGLYGNYGTLVPVVKEETQSEELALLKSTLRDERFFFVVDMTVFEMQCCYGLQKWLGYSEKEFTLKKYWDSVVHPASKKSLLLVIMKMYELLSLGKYPLEFMVQRFSTKIILKHRNGKYYQFKKTSSVFQYDTNNRLLAYMDEFTKIGDHNGETATEPRIYNDRGEDETLKKEEILKKVLEDFIRMKVYSLKELQTARSMAYRPDLTQAQLAKESGLSVYTIKTYCKRLLLKTRDFFNKSDAEIPTAIDAALFLKKEGLV